MKRFSIFYIFLLLFLSLSCDTASRTVRVSRDRLMDKIKGAWAGQTIGCTYGGPTEFRYNGVMIDDLVQIAWPDGHIRWYYDNFPGLYDDVYMDLTFVDVFAKEGLDAPVESFQRAFAHAEYPLWHANQQARYNILNGLVSPTSGHWKINPHADDIDFQIEADYAGIMAPGMVNAAVHYTDDIGHIMNYGDGWYGGVYVAAMYALAFIADDVEYIVEEALKVIPEQSRYWRCMNDVIQWHKENPDDWKSCWKMCAEKHSFDIGCPDGVLTEFNIDAVINSAYILIGLLYGDGDFERTMDISTRCGYDSDCNPASAAGILGTMLGYSGIPEKFMKNLREVEDRDFAYTDISLNEAYRMSFDQALEVIRANGGKVTDEEVRIKVQKPRTVRFEQAFAGYSPLPRVNVGKSLSEPLTISFDGIGIVVRYGMNAPDGGYVAEVEAVLDGGPAQKILLPADFKVRRLELFNAYDLSEGPHTLEFRWLNPLDGCSLSVTDHVVYACMALNGQQKVLTLDDINIRDPYILPVEKEGVYYLYGSSSVNEDGKVYGGMVAYRSRDLKVWEEPVRVFDVPRDNYITGQVWAPEVHEYKGKYYLFATINSDIKWKGSWPGHPVFTHRATQIFWSRKPEGPFLPFEEKTPHTPQGQMCLDGTLWVENGTPYMIYCHEWVEVMDGEMCMVELKKDLSEPVGQPVRLFCASAAEWALKGKEDDPRKHTFVTDGCFLYRTSAGKLLMIWSSFSEGSYAIGIAESATGKVAGPWRQQKDLLFAKNGGHGMLFRDFEGRLCLVFHAPNSPGGQERAHIYEIEDMGNTLRLIEP